MQRTGVAKLPLHYGKAPRWLTIRMRKLAKEIVTIIVAEYGTDDFLKRVSDPFWFQALGCVLGYDWHSSGVTTVVTGVLKHAVTPEEHGIAVCGGKGKISKQTPLEIENVGEKFGFSDTKIERMRYASRMSAKVDNTAIQAGYQLYHHAFIVAEDGKWAVIQQGMCPQDRTARRYHWLSDSVKDFVVEPHTAIVGDARREVALDMTAKESEGCRKASVDIACEPPKKLMHLIMSVRPESQKSLQEWLPKTADSAWKEYSIDFLSMPRTINWKFLQQVYDFQPKNYEELLGFRGVGPATVRGLALVAELIHGEKPSWKDPVKYSFAYGGKDGVPYPVDRRAMDESIGMLKQAIQEAKGGEKEKMRSLQRLRRFVPDNITH
ncbi:MAG: DUF763 domain-containing protein [Candidatus Bathyarchaeota archaeon]|nr:DUF763 domain-containing protein [Candidatus Bathyarchaeota archaeon A05DMB-5]MDH7558305.1 DUF763 domain-containing protein [Candidatus Bathyarchaeota archaeon]